MKSMKQIRSGAILSYITILFSIIAGLIYTPWMVRQIGKSDYGLFILATSFLTYLLTDLGFSNTINRYINIYRAEGKDEKINNLISITTKIYLWFDLLIFAIIFIVYFFINSIFDGLTPLELEKFKVIYLISGLFGILSFPFTSLNGIIMAYERFVWLKTIDLISKFCSILFIAIALWMGYKLYAIVLITAIVGASIIIIKLIYIHKTTFVKIDLNYKDPFLLKDIFRFSSWIFLFLIAELLLLNLTPTILGIFSGTVQIAIFAIGVTLDSYIKSFAVVLNGLFIPRVAQLSVNNQSIERINTLMVKIGRIQLLIIGLFLIGIITLGKQFITLWMGPDFVKSYYVAVLLITPGFIYLTQEIANTFLFVVDKMKYRSVISIISSIFSLILSSILALKYGAIGAAIGICAAYTLGHVIGMNFVFWKLLKLDIPRFFLNCHLKMLLPLCLSLTAGFLIQVYIPANSLLTFVPKAFLLASVYVLLMWLLGLNRSEKELIMSLVRKTVSLTRK